MIKVYFLPTETVESGTRIKGSERIHNALIDSTDKLDIRRVIMDTTSDEDIALTALAIEVRDPNVDELKRFNTFKAEYPVVYRYEAFTKKITHPKRDAPIYVGYEVLEFNEELTAQEISDLEAQLGKTVKKL